MRFRRPKKPSGFETTVELVRKAVADAVEDGEAPSFADLWGDFKPIFAESQRGKCGYCELMVIGGQDGDVEHYAPKAELKMLGPDEQTWGAEAPNSSRVRGRKPMSLSKSGYWWLAYDWSNYLLACAVCNQKWKKNLFPVREPPTRNVPPTQAVLERSLLLSPFAGAKPSKHLRFNADGSVMPLNGSRHGTETIKTVGLDRPSLRFAREPFLSDAYQALHEFADAKTKEVADRALRDLVRLGSENRQFAGAVRTVVEQELRMSWQQVEQAAS
jgi:hypothetical protein